MFQFSEQEKRSIYIPPAPVAELEGYFPISDSHLGLTSFASVALGTQDKNKNQVNA